MPKNHRVRKITCNKCDQPRAGNNALCLLHHRERMAEYRSKVRQQTIEYYSHGTNKCELCSTEYYLEIDHINGGGRQERKELNLPAGWHFYEYLRSKEYPAGYRVLCRGCNAMAHYMTDDEIKQHYLDAAERIQNASRNHQNDSKATETI